MISLVDKYQTYNVAQNAKINCKLVPTAGYTKYKISKIIIILKDWIVKGSKWVAPIYCQALTPTQFKVPISPKGTGAESKILSATTCLWKKWQVDSKRKDME